MSSAPGHFAIIFGTLAGGAIGFYVVHQLEERHKESIRAAIARRDAEIRQENNSFNPSKVAFQNWRHALDANSLELLRDLTVMRRHVADAQAGKRPSEAVARELHGGITERSLQDLRNMEKYLPHFENLLAFALPIQLSEKMSWWRKTLKVRWTSPLSWGASHGSEWGGPRFYDCDDLRYEYAMILTLYATLLRERAMEEVDKVPKEAIRRLREAAGIYDYLSSQVLGELINVLTNVNDRPVEVSPSMALAWKHICLGEAQAITVQTAEKSRMSLGRLADLHKGCAELYEKALVLIEDYKSEWRELSEKFLRYLKVSKTLHELKMRRLLAENVAKSDDNGMGKAVMFLRIAKAQLPEKPPGDEEWRAVYTKELEAFEKHFKTVLYDNDNIYRHKEPLEANLPEVTSIIIVEPVAYKKSTPSRDFHFT